MTMKTLLLGSALSLSVLCTAQNTPWTAAAIDGNTYNVQTILDGGRTVLVDMSAHWCSPCWAWHKSGIMEQVYEDFGPGGTNDVEIFYIDGTSAFSGHVVSTLPLLQGIGVDTQGDWTAGTPYPIVGPNGAGVAVAGHYTFSGFPTLFVHCPGAANGVEIARDNFWPFLASWRAMCSTAFVNAPIDATVVGTSKGGQVCVGEAATMGTSLFNAGSTTLTSATVQLKHGATVVQTINWTGSLAAGAHADLTFNPQTITSATSYTVEVTLPNGTADGHAAGDVDHVNFTVPTVAVGWGVELTLITDNYGAETYWQMEDPAGTVVAHGGNDAVGTTLIGQGTGAAPANANAYGNNTTTVVNIPLASMGCYKFVITDYYGDGICCAYGNGSYSLKDLSTNSVVYSGGSIGAMEEDRMNNTHVGILEANGAANSLTIFPNPTEGLVNLRFNVSTSAKANVDVYNVLGEVVKNVTRTFTAVNQNQTIDLSDLENGAYYMNVTVNGVTSTRAITVSK